MQPVLSTTFITTNGTRYSLKSW